MNLVILSVCGALELLRIVGVLSWRSGWNMYYPLGNLELGDGIPNSHALFTGQWIKVLWKATVQDLPFKLCYLPKKWHLYVLPAWIEVYKYHVWFKIRQIHNGNIREASSVIRSAGVTALKANKREGAAFFYVRWIFLWGVWSCVCFF